MLKYRKASNFISISIRDVSSLEINKHKVQDRSKLKITKLFYKIKQKPNIINFIVICSFYKSNCNSPILLNSL